MNELKQILVDDHLSLERVLTQLADSLDGDSAAVCETWTRADRHIRNHFDSEERCLFPLVAATHRAEVERLRAEHESIRCALSEFGVAADLHLLRKASVDELIARLRRHAAEEEHSLYDWAQDNPQARRGVSAMLRLRSAASLT